MSSNSYYSIMNKSNRLIDNNTSLLDQAYRAATNSEKFFENGIGDQSYLDQLVYYLENIKGPQNINVEWDNSYNFFKKRFSFSTNW